MRELLGNLVIRFGNRLIRLGDRIAGYEVVAMIPFLDLEPEHALKALHDAERRRREEAA